jgi:transglutaminase-like putative cysteine protease
MWSNPIEQYPILRQPDGRFPLWSNSAGSGLKMARPIHYRVLMEPIGTNLFFVAPKPRFLAGAYRVLGTDRGGAVYNLDASHTVSLYDVDSDLAEPKPQDLENVTAPNPAEMLEYLRLPPNLDARIPELARQIAGTSTNSYDRATAIERYLMTKFGYTLELPRVAPKDPLAEFLFVRKRGHCEYFASSMAIMLRTLNIPSRVVNGFRTTEFNDVTGNYVVRASSAHSWVEAYFPGYDWVSFDPTPGPLWAAQRVGAASASMWMP